MPVGVAPLQRSPGGDFGWLKKNYTMTIRGTTSTEDGATHGHNIVAADFNYVADPTNTTSPGGTYPAAQLSCTSCHDPHGKYRRLSDGSINNTGAPIIGSGSYHNSADPAAGQAVGVYRLLAGIGYTKVGTGTTFAVDPPAAVVNSSYNRTEAATQTRVAYGQGMGLWCATCHKAMHSAQGGGLNGGLVHPVDESMGSTIVGIYNSYIQTGDVRGTQPSSYLSLVPYQENSKDYTALKALAAVSATASIPGPQNGNAQVFCLSCHRAHASGFVEMSRWNNEGEFITYNGLWPGTDTTPSVPQFARGRLGAETQASYYDRPATVFASYQRSLCNKCHAQD